MSLLRLVLACSLAFTVAGCSNDNNSGIAFPFERAEHLAFVCFAPKPAPLQDQFVVLPQSCCRLTDPSALGYQPATAQAPLPQECARAGADLVGDTSRLHALVTQSTRGEVAAVDLVNNRVLDSDRLVPGFTFLDTGGLPSAIVAPAVQPRVATPAGSPSVIAGPAWTYIASAEESSVRAIATCRFRSGGACGPDLLDENREDPRYDLRTRVPLPSAPRDMLLGPGPNGPDQALWVTLPDRGLIARIDLAETPVVRADPNVADSPLVARAVDPFLLAENRVLAEPTFFSVPTAGDVVPREPVAEESEYTALCGLGETRPFQPVQRELPLASDDARSLAPRTEPTPQVQPDRMHFDALSGLLLVTDRMAPVLHAFRYASDGALEALGALPTGSAVREFVITPPVPENQPRDLLTNPAPAEDPSRNTKRYLYAIDERGLLMLFDFVSDQSLAGVMLQPLLAPTPGTSFADRIELPAPVTALDVIDTRTSSDYVCGHEPRSTLAARLGEAKKLPEPRSVVEEATIDQLEARISIEDRADSGHLRGVFLAAASANGVLSIIDVHDLDASCRARKDCCASDPCTSQEDLARPRDTGSPDVVAIRRHTVRRAIARQLQANVSNTALLSPIDCSEGFVPLQPSGDRALVCAPSDPWVARSETWTVVYQGAIPNSQTSGAALAEANADRSQAELLAPIGRNWCDLGVQKDDLVAVLGEPPRRLLDRCKRPTPETATLLQIREAFADRLVVTAPDEAALASSTSTKRSLAELMDCYPDNVGVELRAGGFLVVGVGGTYLHRVTSDASGRCIDDERKDVALASRPRREGADDTLVFRNPYVEFGLAGEQSRLGNTAVTVRNGSSGLQLTSVATGNTTTDALPAAVRYEPNTAALFLLDTASQGLRRYTLRPFRYDTRSFR